MANALDEKRLDGLIQGDGNSSSLNAESGARLYEIRVKGYLNPEWSDWLEGLEVKYLESGEMILFGPIVDQAALIGVLNKLSRLNLSLLSVNETKRNDRLEAK